MLHLYFFMGIGTFCIYFILQERMISKLKVLLLSVVYMILIPLILMIIPFQEKLPEVILLFIVYIIILVLLTGLLTVTGEKGLKRTMFYTLSSYLSWDIFNSCAVGMMSFLVGRYVPAVYSIGTTVASCVLAILLVRLAVLKYNLGRIVEYLENRVDTWSKMIMLYMGFIIVTIITDIIGSYEEGVNAVNVLIHPLFFVGLLAFLNKVYARITAEDGKNNDM